MHACQEEFWLQMPNKYLRDKPQDNLAPGKSFLQVFLVLFSYLSKLLAFRVKARSSIIDRLLPKPDEILRIMKPSNRGRFINFAPLSFEGKSDKRFALTSHSTLLNPFGFQLSRENRIPSPFCCYQHGRFEKFGFVHWGISLWAWLSKHG